MNKRNPHVQSNSPYHQPTPRRRSLHSSQAHGKIPAQSVQSTRANQPQANPSRTNQPQANPSRNSQPLRPSRSSQPLRSTRSQHRTSYGKASDTSRVRTSSASNASAPTSAHRRSSQSDLATAAHPRRARQVSHQRGSAAQGARPHASTNANAQSRFQAPPSHPFNPLTQISNPFKQPGDPDKSTASSVLEKLQAALGAVVGFTGWLWQKSRIATGALALVLVLLVAGAGDFLANMNRIYEGVYVGNINLSGKTVEEATSLIAQEYEPRFLSNKAVFFANSEAEAQYGSNSSQQESLEEQISYEESLKSRNRWTVTSQSLGASFDPAQYAQEAYQVGRENGWMLGRVAAKFAGTKIEPECTFNATSFDELRDEIIKVLGKKMVNFNVKLNGTKPEVTEGNDGYEVTAEWLTEKLNEAFLRSSDEVRCVVKMQDVPIQITQGEATKTAQLIEKSLPAGAQFEYDGKQWFADENMLAKWVYTKIEQEGSGYALKACFDEKQAMHEILKGFGFVFSGENYTVHFTKDNNSIRVNTNATGNVPEIRLAVQELDNNFFTSNDRAQPPVFKIGSAQIPETMTFTEALDYGLIVDISSFTTQYASGAAARNKNIHIVSDYLNKSICKAGETWSFLALSGEATPDKGYEGAGAIVGGEYSDAIGGGICQVATTVYNAIYEAGYPINQRYPHSLYIASYPEGRDAAIAYPDMDLVWQNDTESDVLLMMTYTNSSVTATLYGTNPGYVVETVTGEWDIAEKYKTIYKKSPDYPVGTEFVDTRGSDGRFITITRIVKDRNGNVIRETEIKSYYKPQNEVILQGTAE